MPDLFERVSGLLAVTVEVFTQRFRLRNLPGIDSIGGPAEGLTIIVTGPTSLSEALLRVGSTGLYIASLTMLASLTSEEVDRLPNCQGYTKSVDGLELHMATNYLGPFLLTMLLLPALRRTGTQERPARVVNLASKMSETCTLNQQDPLLSRPHAWNSVYAYSHSKLCQQTLIVVSAWAAQLPIASKFAARPGLQCQWAFSPTVKITQTAEMRRRLAGDNRLFVCSVDPGLVVTNVVRSTPGWVQWLYHMIMKTLLATPKEGARSSVHCATSKHITNERSPSQSYINFDCTPIKPKARFLNADAGRWLWKWSAQTTGLPAELHLPEQHTD